MTNQLLNPGALAVSQATIADLAPILQLFDEAVAWLNQRSLEKQWGTQPFSAFPQRREQFLRWITQEVMFAAHIEDRIVGSLALSPVAPAYIASRWECFPSSALYLEAFVTTRALVGHGLGRALLHWAERHARAHGRTTIWLDCWGENLALVRYYQHMGFVPRGAFMVKDWRGQLFEKQLT